MFTHYIHGAGHRQKQYYGRLLGQSYEDGDTVTYKYDNSGGLASVTDSASGITTKYYYDFTDRLMKYTESGTDFSHSVGYTYDKLNNLTGLTETINGTTATTTYTYDDDNRIRTVTNGDIVETYSYDAYGRVVRQVITRNGETVVTLGFAYKTNSDGTPTNQVGRVAVHSSIYDVSYGYLYDANGNIYRVSDGTNAITYVYDTQNQLLRENNPYIGKSFRYYYDDAGNITQRREYAYTTGTLENYTAIVNYDYSDPDWGDLLTSYNGQTITYDTIGNPLSDGTWTYTWEHGRQLASMASDTVTWTYAYNADGLRTSRSNGTDTYTYVYNGSSLSQMTIGDNVLRFAYDASGHAGTVTWNGTVYYYATNLQGDIIAILDADGNAVVEYIYDAWGNIHSTSGTLAETLGYYNPLRYRGYVYDNETGLYYLQSRYYNPEIGRFINADGQISGVGSKTLGYNQFAYCFNNPVNMSDSAGNWPQWLKKAVKWVAEEIVDPVVKTAQKVLAKSDVTVTKGFTVSATASIFSATGTPCVSADTEGNVALQLSGSVGITSNPGLGLTGGKTAMVTNAPSVSKLEGPALQGGGSLFVPVPYSPVSVGGGADLNIIPDSDLGKTYYGLSLFTGISSSVGPDIHFGSSGTISLYEFNVFNFYDDMYEAVIGW